MMTMQLPDPKAAHASSLPSEAGKQRLLATWGNPLFYAGWLDVVFLHFETDPATLQKEVPWELDLFEGRAFVSLVAFTMRDMRPRLGGCLTALPFKPIATHEFLNVRAYVKHEGEPGIHFLKEWVPNPLSIALGPTVFGLPYQLGRLHYANKLEGERAAGHIEDVRSGGRFEYTCRADPIAPHASCAANSLDEFLVERYTAFTSFGLRRLFRIWHPPWPVTPLQAEVRDHGLLHHTGRWSHDARLISAHHSPGIEQVWMGRPHFVSPRRNRAGM